MSIPLLILIFLITAVPGCLVAADQLVDGLATLATAAMLVGVASTASPGETRYLLSVLRPVLIVAAIPAAWMLIQILPLGALGLAHPIWPGAEEALADPMPGSISIDRGATVIALVRYLTALGILLAAAALAADRGRAEQILLTMTAATALAAILVIAAALGLMAPQISVLAADRRAGAADSVALGAIISSAAAITMFERHPAGRPGAAPDLRFWKLGACIAATVVCLTAVALAGNGPRLIAVAAAGATLAAVAVVRRLGLGPWGIAAIVAAAAVTIIAVLTIVPPTLRPGDVTLAFAAETPASNLVLTERALADIGWTGIGAGAYAALAPIYRGARDIAAGTSAPTVAAAIAADLGRTALALCIGLTIAGAIRLLHGALRRGRDAFYPAAGASCLLAALIMAFSDNGLFDTSVLILLATTLGLAFAQSRSRTVG